MRISRISQFMYKFHANPSNATEQHRWLRPKCAALGLTKNWWIELTKSAQFRQQKLNQSLSMKGSWHNPRSTYLPAYIFVSHMYGYNEFPAIHLLLRHCFTVAKSNVNCFFSNSSTEFHCSTKLIPLGNQGKLFSVYGVLPRKFEENILQLFTMWCRSTVFLLL